MKNWLLTLFFFLFVQFLFSQEVISASFGVASDAGGSLEYTVGQVFYQENTGTGNFSVTEGVHQRHEIVNYIYDDFWFPKNPNGISLGEDNIFVEFGNVSITSNTSCDTLSINAGSSLTIETGVLLFADKTILNSNSQSYSSMIAKGLLLGPIEYNRFVAKVGPVGSNDLISSPILAQNFGDFALDNPNLASSGTIRAFAPYNTNTGAYENFDVSVNFDTNIDSGKGYRVATTDGSNLKFSGFAPNAEISIRLLDASLGGAWNLIGNPYPAYLDFESFFNENKDQFEGNGGFQAIYGYDGDASDGWTVWNLATIADTDITELIAPGQAFFVKSKIDGGRVSFKKSMQRIGNADDFIVGKSEENNIAYSTIELSSSKKSTSTSIYFIEGTTKGLDSGYDASLYSNQSASLSIYSELPSNPSSLQLAIQSLPYKSLGEQKIPLGIKSAVDDKLTIDLDAKKSKIPDDISVFLEDKVNGTFTNLKKSNYSFLYTSNLAVKNRFFLHYGSSTLSVDDLKLDENIQVISLQSKKELLIKGDLHKNATVKIYDVSGKNVLQKNIDNLQNELSINLSKLNTGIYFVLIFNDEKFTYKKIIIN
ncbi:T9SS type A sorting domain-containing protein [uncultured Polaribacter sp.]|uniref:T9SS type A sorting domain-containing protein n=1 Tax=uncultured Polaribacter sp. TaxID=174711 RepID=UPI00262831EB|nr:T9SS type A sorting domain-containing protein [uncultured Polaribacter sp.]